jgi:hypothetical protein
MVFFQLSDSLQIAISLRVPAKKADLISFTLSDLPDNLEADLVV